MIARKGLVLRKCRYLPQLLQGNYTGDGNLTGRPPVWRGTMTGYWGTKYLISDKLPSMSGASSVISCNAGDNFSFGYMSYLIWF